MSYSDHVTAWTFRDSIPGKGQRFSPLQFVQTGSRSMRQ